MLFLLVGALSSCTRHTELDKTAIAEAVGIDKDGSGYTVTVQYFNMDKSGGAAIVDETEPNVITVSGSGASVESALDAVSFICGKRISVGNTGVIVIGRDALYGDLGEILSFMSDDPVGNQRSMVTAAENRASDIMEIKFSEGNSSVDKLKGIINNAERLGICPVLRLYELNEKLCQPTHSAALPLLGAREDMGDMTNDKKSAVICGGMLYSEGKEPSYLSVEEMSGVTLLSAKRNIESVTFTENGRASGAELFGLRCGIKPKFAEGKLILDINISAYCGMTDSGDDTRQKCSALLASRVSGALEASAAKGCDICDLKYGILRDPSIWRMIEEDYPAYLSDMTVNVSCELTER